MRRNIPDYGTAVIGNFCIFAYLVETTRPTTEFMAKFSYIDLFSGIGGFHIALDSVGGECLGFSEIYQDAIDSYCENFKIPVEKNFGDITKLETLPATDMITAGVPCQSWSIAGKNLGFDDDRGQLWNDTLYLLNKVKPKAFIFENVKGLSDPRNKEALDYILSRIKEADYYAKKYVLNAYDYGSAQTRVRIYIIGFKKKRYLNKFSLPAAHPGEVHLWDIVNDVEGGAVSVNEDKARWSLSCNALGFNDYFLFNDIRNGATTVHSWDIIDTTQRQKDICTTILSNRRSKKYGILDGNALSLQQLKTIDPSIKKSELESLVKLGILKHYKYRYELSPNHSATGANERVVLSRIADGLFLYDELKTDKEIKKLKLDLKGILDSLEESGSIKCSEIRYEFKNTKISTGIDGINRIILPSSKIYPTLVASDTNDFIATVNISGNTEDEWKANFMRDVFFPQKYRKITKSEACMIQGFPGDFILPEQRERWMHLIGNSVAVPVIKMLVNAVVQTGVFDVQP